MSLYNDIRTKIERSRTKQVKHSYACYWHILDENTIALRHHNTDIIKLDRRMYATLDNGGWYSVTTKKKLNSVLKQFGVSIVQQNFVWYICYGSRLLRNTEWKNGIVLSV